MTKSHQKPGSIPESIAVQQFSRAVGKTLAVIRDLRNLSQKQLADDLSFHVEASISAEDVNRVETGRDDDFVSCFFIWCEIIGCRPSQVCIIAESLSEHDSEADILRKVCSVLHANQS